MAKIEVIKDLCKGCGLCLGICPKKILKLSSDINKNGDHYCVQVDSDTCTGCKFCGLICPDCAIKVYK